MISGFPILEGDYCFSLPSCFSNKTHVNQEEKKMNTRSESASKAKGKGNGKGNGPQQQGRRSNEAASASGSDECPREQMIAEAAYFRAEQRGFAPGNEMSDWLQAEADVKGVHAQ